MAEIQDPALPRTAESPNSIPPHDSVLKTFATASPHRYNPRVRLRAVCMILYETFPETQFDRVTLQDGTVAIAESDNDRLPIAIVTENQALTQTEVTQLSSFWSKGLFIISTAPLTEDAQNHIEQSEAVDFATVSYSCFA